MVRLRDIFKLYPMGKRELEVVRGISLDIEKGEMVAIMGASGSGKTTLLNIIGCLYNPTSGSYYLEDREVSRLSSGELAKVRGRIVGFVFQTFNLLPHFLALANMELGLRYAGGSDSRRALELSGGEQQRVAIARALAKKPPLILSDEPTGNLDSCSGEEIISILTTLHGEQGITLVVITHESNIAHQCQRIIHLKDGQVIAKERV
jgi:putative ABC transport system ATP-binding protein